MTALTKSAQITFDEFCLLVKDKQKADLIDGVIYMASPENTDANALLVWMLSVMGTFVRRRKLGNIYGSRVAFKIGETQGPEPDIGFVAKDRLHLVKRGHVAGAPDLAVEIVSPDSIDRDYVQKRKQYEDAGVKEYWIVDELEEMVVLLRLQSNGKFREVRPKSGVLQSKVIPGLYVRPEWFWQEPLPDSLEIVQEMLERSE